MRLENQQKTLDEEKRTLRAIMRERAKSISPAEWAELSAGICERLSALAAYQAAQTVFCFVGTAREINTAPFLQSALDAGKRLCAPVCTGPGLMELRRIATLSELSPGAYGILEPSRQAPPVRAPEVDFAVVPCLCCTRAGLRLGKGGGYYDRFLADYRGVAVLICPERLVAERVPMDAHDVAVPRVLTERGLFVNGQRVL